MFTGIVQHVGVVKQVRPLSDNSIQIDVDCKDLNSTSSLGQSISTVRHIPSMEIL